MSNCRNLIILKVHHVLVIFILVSFINFSLWSISKNDGIPCFSENTNIFICTSAIENIEELHHKKALIYKRIVLAFLRWHFCLIGNDKHFLVYPELILSLHPDWTVVEHEEEHHLLVNRTSKIMKSYIFCNNFIFLWIVSLCLINNIIFFHWNFSC